MSEMMKNLAMFLWVACAINSSMPPAEAQGIREEKEMTAPSGTAPTIIFGRSERSDGTADEFVLEQPAGSANPLGNPLAETMEAADGGMQNTVLTPQQPAKEKAETQPTDAAAQKLGTQFQNTLMEADGTVYDIQAYPAEDLKAIGNPSNPETIYSPNVNP